MLPSDESLPSQRMDAFLTEALSHAALILKMMIVFVKVGKPISHIMHNINGTILLNFQILVLIASLLPSLFDVFVSFDLMNSLIVFKSPLSILSIWHFGVLRI